LIMRNSLTDQRRTFRHMPRILVFPPTQVKHGGTHCWLRSSVTGSNRMILRVPHPFALLAKAWVRSLLFPGFCPPNSVLAGQRQLSDPPCLFAFTQLRFRVSVASS
jgi:hypothetical protein